MLTAETQYSNNFWKSNRKFCLILHYNGNNSFLLVNTIKIYPFKAKDSEIKKISLVFRKSFRSFFWLITWKKKKKKKKKKNRITGLNGRVYGFSVDYKAFDISEITNFYKYLMKKTWYKNYIPTRLRLN